MRFFPSSCCFCFKIHQAFIYIIYLDMIRLLWVVLFTILLFLKPLATVVDYAFNAVTLSATFSECFNALKSLNYGFLKNDYSVHKRYFMAKLVFVIGNIVKLCSLVRLNCTVSNQANSSECIQKQLDAQFFVDAIWTLFEVYCTLVVYSFCQKVGKGSYGPVGGTPIFPDFDLVDISFYKEGICLESRGIKLKNWLGKFLEVGMEIGQQIQGSEFQKKTKLSAYWRIFPKPLIWGKKSDVELCDLSEMMALRREDKYQIMN